MGRSVLRLKSRKTRRNNKNSKRFLNKNKNKRSRRVLRKRTRKRKFLGGSGDGAAAAAAPRCGQPAKLRRKPGMKVRTVKEIRSEVPKVPPDDPIFENLQDLGLPPFTPEGKKPPIEEEEKFMSLEELGLGSITKDGEGEDILMDEGELFGDEPKYVNAQAIKEFEKAKSEDMFSTIVRKLSKKEPTKTTEPTESTKPTKPTKALSRTGAIKAKSKYRKKIINKLIVTLTTIKDNNSSDAFYRKFQHDLDVCDDEYVMKISITALLNNFYSILNLFNFSPHLLVVFTGHGGMNVTTVSGDTTVPDECSASTESELVDLQTKFKLPKYKEILEKTQGMITELNGLMGASIDLLFSLLEELHKKFEINYTIIFYICKGAYNQGKDKGLCTGHFPENAEKFTFLKNATLYCNENNVPRMENIIYPTRDKTDLDVISDQGIALAQGKNLEESIYEQNLNEFFYTEYKLKDTGQDKFNWTKYTYTNLGNSLKSVSLNVLQDYSVNTLQRLLDVIYG